MNRVFLYDGSYFSLINLVLKLLKLENNPLDIKSEKNYENNLLDDVIRLELNNINLDADLPGFIIHITYYVYLSENKNKELIIYYFLKNYFKYFNDILKHRNLKCVNEALKVSKYVSNEAHKLKGFLRFEKMENNFYYACINPTNNVLPILANHFQKRLKQENWLIYDSKRNLYVMYDKRKVSYLDNGNISKLNLNLDKNESEINILWKTFFKTISIKERKNLRCQMNFMPKKYWNNLLEMEDEL